MDEVLNDFLIEAGETLAELDIALLTLEHAPDDRLTLSQVFRLVHTIKGICGFLALPRLERVAQNPDVILDGAHNPAGARALAAYISEFFREQPVRIIFGAMRDKAIDEVTETLFPLAQEVVITAPDQPRALNPEALAEVCGHPNVRTATCLRDALSLSAGRPMTTFITGSLYLVGEARGIYGTQALHGHVG